MAHEHGESPGWCVASAHEHGESPGGVLLARTSKGKDEKRIPNIGALES